MALNITIQLSSSKGLNRIIHFDGLSHSIIIHPTIHGEPLLTAQAYHYLDQMESVATVRYESNKNELTDKQLEYLIDNYLFALSKKDEHAKVTTKAIFGKYWLRDPSEMYGLYDNRSTETLELDTLNEPSLTVSSLDSNEKIDFNDWCLVRNYSDHIFEEYLKKIGQLIDKKVMVVAPPNSERDGYIGKARLIKCEGNLLNHFQAHQLDNLTTRDVPKNATSLNTKSSYPGMNSITVERITLNQNYNPILLSYYFSGLKEENPLLAFVGFYNVLEYYFEEAPTLLGITAPNELKQLNCVLSLLTDNSRVTAFINKLPLSTKNAINLPLQTSSGVPLSPLTQTGAFYTLSDAARWLYEIRCAIIHSKKTRRGLPTPTISPYTDQIQNIAPSLPLIKWLAILCIEKDQTLGFPSTI